MTGASGFIGARTVEYLILATGGSVRCLVRSYSRLSRLAELPQERLSFHCADVLDPDAVRAALAGCDTVIHCAYGSDGDREQRSRTTVDGTKLVVKVAAELGIRRFVHISTVAIHDAAHRDAIREDTPTVPARPGRYATAKLAAEEIVLGSSLEAIALRPAVVYGPWGKDWTMIPLERLARGVQGLPGGRAPGVCNAVFIDDVVRAIVRACASRATGPVLIASDEHVTWGKFYDAFRALIPEPIVLGPAAIEEWEEDFYASRAQVDITRARQVLGYQPATSFTAGMQKVAAWVAWYRGGARSGSG